MTHPLAPENLLKWRSGVRCMDGCPRETTSRGVGQAPSIPGIPLWADLRRESDNRMAWFDEAELTGGRGEGRQICRISGEGLSNWLFFLSLSPAQNMVPPEEEKCGPGLPRNDDDANGNRRSDKRDLLALGSTEKQNS